MSHTIRDLTEGELETMLVEHKRLNPDLPIRPDIKEALDQYAFFGHPVGNFLTAVLANDLFDALGRADSYNRATIFQITGYIYNELPSTCWGSREKVEAHYRSFESGTE